MEKKLVLCDTNILIDFLRGRKDIIINLKKIGKDNIAISSVTEAELLFGARNKSEKQQIFQILQELHILHLNEDISKLCVSLKDQDR